MNIKTFAERKFFGITFVFLLLGISMIMAGNVVVDDGALDVDDDLNVNPGVLYVDSANGWVGIGMSPGIELDVAGDIKVSSGNDICIDDNCLSSIVEGDITEVTGTSPLTFTGCDTGICSIGMDTDDTGVCDAGAVCTAGHTHLVGDTDISDGAVDGGLLGEIEDNTITADDLTTNSVGNDELIDEVFVPDGIRIGQNHENSEISNGLQGSNSNPLFIGNQRITTENIDDGAIYELEIKIETASDTRIQFQTDTIENYFDVSKECGAGYTRIGCSGRFTYVFSYRGTTSTANGCRSYAWGIPEPSGWITPDYTIYVYTMCAKLNPI